MLSNDSPSFLRSQLTDYHCHILPGIDDGSQGIGESVDMAIQLAAAGFRQVYCTPHLIKGLYEATTADVLNEVVKLQTVLDEEGIALHLLVGREYYLDEYFLHYLNQPLLMQGTSYLLIEIPDQALPHFVKNVFFEIVCKGYIPIVAHPERCGLFHGAFNPDEARKPWFIPATRKNSGDLAPDALLKYLCELQCGFQANIGSFKGIYGSHVQNAARDFESKGLYTHKGSDAHSANILKVILNGKNSTEHTEER